MVAVVVVLVLEVAIMVASIMKWPLSGRLEKESVYEARRQSR